MKNKPHVQESTKKHRQPMVKPFPSMEEFKAGVARAAERKKAKIMYARLAKEDEALGIADEDL